MDIWFVVGFIVVIFLLWMLICRVFVCVFSFDEFVLFIIFLDGLLVGVFGCIVCNLLKEWYVFGIGLDGFLKNIMICGVVGDFIKCFVIYLFIYLWIRMVCFVGVVYLVNMYKRVVFVGMGFGLGLFLFFIM